jgi:hypothetical protein
MRIPGIDVEEKWEVRNFLTFFNSQRKIPGVALAIKLFLQGICKI